MNYYPFHIGDYASATRHLSWDEDAAYRRLLDVYYTTEAPLPSDLRACCRLVLATTEAQREAVRVVLEEFFQQTPDGWRNGRADTEIAEMKRKQQAQRDKANRRWAKPNPESGTASAMPRHEAEDAAASEKRADAMPPTPTPTPTPTPEEETKTPAAAGPVSRAPNSKSRTRTPGATPLPAEWVPKATDVERLAVELRLAPEVVRVSYAESFRDVCSAKGYLYRDHDAAFRNCVRQDWPRLRAVNGSRQNAGNDPFAGAA